MTKKSAIFLGCGGLALLVLLCGGVVGTIGYFFYAATQPAADAANQFLQLCADGKLDEAYKSTSSTCQAGQTLEQFKQTAKILGLTEYQSASWLSRNVTGNQATLTGTMQTKSGKSVQLTVVLNNDDGSWRVQLASRPDVQFAPTDVKPE